MKAKEWRKEKEWKREDSDGKEKWKGKKTLEPLTKSWIRHCIEAIFDTLCVFIVGYC